MKPSPFVQLVCWIYVLTLAALAVALIRGIS